MHPFVHLSIGFWLYTALQCRSSMSSNCLVFHTSGGISSSPAAFLFFIFLSTESSSTCVNGPSLLSNCLLIILVIGSWVTYEASSGSCPIFFKVLTFNVAICIVRLHFSYFCLNSVADFSNTEARAPTSAGRAPFLPACRAMRFGHVVWVWVMVIFRWLFLFSSTDASLIDEQQ